MSETITTRNEHSRSLEQAVELRAVQTLTRLGVLLPLDGLDMAHGRVKEASENGNWAVDSDFNNQGNSTGNRNINNRPTLYTATSEIATEFATKRHEAKKRIFPDKKFEEEVHEIISSDGDASIINRNFSPLSLDDDQLQEYHESLRELLPGLLEASPLSFDERHDYPKVYESVKKLGDKLFYSDDDASNVAIDAGVSRRLALQIMGSANARRIASYDPVALIDSLLMIPGDMYRVDVDDVNINIPINAEYVYQFMRKAHVVGIKQGVMSATLGHRPVQIVSLFGLDKIQSSVQQKARKENVGWRYGKIALSLHELDSDIVNGEKPELMRSLTENPHVKPEKLIELARKIEGYDEILSMGTGNWEGFSLAEHIETVLDNFDENFADIVPVELLPAMRLMIISHDLGKPIASEKGRKHLQKQYNKVQALDFYNKLGIDKKLQDLLINIIIEGEEIAFEMQKIGGQDSKDRMEELANKCLSKYFGTNEITTDMIGGFYGMCQMLYLCDGGAYTSMAVTRKDKGIYHRNSPSFNDSFSANTGAVKRKVKPRTQNGSPPSADLAPKI